MNKWSEKSQAKLDTCHKDLRKIANAVLAVHDCTIITGHRDRATQERMFREGKSRKHYPDGMHNKKPSRAIDLAPYRPNVNMWEREYSLYFSGIVLGIAEMLLREKIIKHKIRWGGNWSTVRDGKSFKDVSLFDPFHYEIR